MTTGGIVLLCAMALFFVFEVLMIVRDRLKKKHDSKYQELCSIVDQLSYEFDLPKNEVARRLLRYGNEQQNMEESSNGAPIDYKKS